MNTHDKLAGAIEHTARHRAAADGIDPDKWRAVLYGWEDRALATHAAEAAQAQVQGGKWVMVPKEPTERMLQAAEDAVNAASNSESTTDDLSAVAYKAALNAAPSPPAVQPANQDEKNGDQRMVIAPWLSAALGDPNVCDEMKADINKWFDVMAKESGR